MRDNVMEPLMLAATATSAQAKAFDDKAGDEAGSKEGKEKKAKKEEEVNLDELDDVAATGQTAAGNPGGNPGGAFKGQGKGQGGMVVDAEVQREVAACLCNLAGAEENKVGRKARLDEKHEPLGVGRGRRFEAPCDFKRPLGRLQKTSFVV